MPSQMSTYDNFDYESYRNRVDFFLQHGGILAIHIPRFAKGGEMDVRARHHLSREACVEVVIADRPAKVVGVVATRIRKNFAGINMGRVIEVMYDRDDRTYKKNLIKVKSLFGGGGQTYMEIFAEQREWWNKLPG